MEVSATTNETASSCVDPRHRSHGRAHPVIDHPWPRADPHDRDYQPGAGTPRSRCAARSARTPAVHGASSAINPDDGKGSWCRMNPGCRALGAASKATGFPIAKICRKLAVGYTLSELRTKSPGARRRHRSSDHHYVVTKDPRFTVEKFPGANPLDHQMKSVGGRSWRSGRDVSGIHAVSAAESWNRLRRIQ